MKPVQIWSYDDAPEEYQKLSSHGGDEDLVVLIPKEYINEQDGMNYAIERLLGYPDLSGFSSSSRNYVGNMGFVQIEYTEDGVVLITAHA